MKKTGMLLTGNKRRRISLSGQSSIGTGHRERLWTTLILGRFGRPELGKP